MDERDLAYLRTVAAVIGQEIEKLAFIEQDLNGARLYSCRTVRDDLNAVHTGLKYFIRDRTAPGTIIDPVTHLDTPPVDFDDPTDVPDTDATEQPLDDPYETDMSQINEDLTWMPDEGDFGYHPSDDARPRGRHQVDGFS